MQQDERNVDLYTVSIAFERKNEKNISLPAVSNRRKPGTLITHPGDNMILLFHQMFKYQSAALSSPLLTEN